VAHLELLLTPQTLPLRLVEPPTPAPLDPFVAGLVSARLPLAEASLLLLDHVTHDDFLRGVFDRYRGHSYERVISFPVFVRLISDALLEHDAVARQSFLRAQQDGTLEATLAAAYGKLARVPLTLSQGLLLEASRRLQELFPAAASTPLPPSLAPFNLVVVDGKKIKHVARRLKATRQTLGQLFGGKLVVALALSSRLAVAMAADADGEVSDTPLLPQTLRQARQVVPGPRLWIADRLFCDLDQPALFSQDGDHFLIRYNARVTFQRDQDEPLRQGKTAKGESYVEEWGWLGTAKDPRRRYVRRITLFRPGHPEGDVILVTDLLEAEQFLATDLLEAYLLRWEVENCFQRVTEVFALRRLIGGTPEATVYQAAFCLVLHNVVTVLRGYVAQGSGQEAEAISLEELFKDVERQLISWNAVFTVSETVGLLQGFAAEQLGRRLQELLGGAFLERWRKTTGSGKPKVKGPKVYPPGGHTSVYRLLRAARRARSRPPSPEIAATDQGDPPPTKQDLNRP
jgi:hypothetical protein